MRWRKAATARRLCDPRHGRRRRAAGPAADCRRQRFAHGVAAARRPNNVVFAGNQAIGGNGGARRGRPGATRRRRWHGRRCCRRPRRRWRSRRQLQFWRGWNVQSWRRLRWRAAGLPPATARAGGGGVAGWWRREHSRQPHGGGAYAGGDIFVMASAFDHHRQRVAEWARGGRVRSHDDGIALMTACVRRRHLPARQCRHHLRAGRRRQTISRRSPTKGSGGATTNTAPNTLSSAGIGSLVLDGAGTLVLAAASTFTGGVTLKGGTLSITAAGAGSARSISRRASMRRCWSLPSQPREYDQRFGSGTSSTLRDSPEALRNFSAATVF